MDVGRHEPYISFSGVFALQKMRSGTAWLTA